MRFRVRHVQQTLVDYLTGALTALGWMGPDVPYDLPPVTITEDVDVEDAPADLQPNTMAVTIPDEGPDLHQQLGGGLLAVDYSLFLDVYGSSGVMATRILQDCKEVLRDRVLIVMDYSGSTPVQTDVRCELDIMGIERPPRLAAGAMEARRRWRLLTATATVTFPED